MQLSEHFSFEELTTTTCADLLSANRQMANQEPILSNLNRLCELLEWARTVLSDSFSYGLKINSGYRMPVLNSRIGGSPTSQHMRGEAADFPVGDGGQEDTHKAVIMLARAAKIEGRLFGQILEEYGCIHISLGTACEVAFAKRVDGRWMKVPLSEKDIQETIV